MIEQLTDARHVRGWLVSERSRLFPPNRNREALERVVDIYQRLDRPDSENTAPWQRIHSLPELPGIYTRVNQKANELRHKLDAFNGNSDKSKMEDAVDILQQALENAYGSDLKNGEYTGALHDAMVLILFRTYKDSDQFRFYRWNRNAIPDAIQKLLFHTENYVLWETVAGRTGLDSHPNPFKSYVELFNEGACDVVLGRQNEQSFATIVTSRKNDERTLTISF